jgi:hypothetical protein
VWENQFAPPKISADCICIIAKEFIALWGVESIMQSEHLGNHLRQFHGRCSRLNLFWLMLSPFLFICRQWYLPGFQGAMQQRRRRSRAKFKFRHEMFSVYMSGEAPVVVLLTTRRVSMRAIFGNLLFFVQKSPAAQRIDFVGGSFKGRSPN